MNDKKEVLDHGSFFHGTKAELKTEELLEAQHVSNYRNKKSNHSYFTATLDAAKWGDELAVARSKERIYVVVEPLENLKMIRM